MIMTAILLVLCLLAAVYILFFGEGGDGYGD